MRQFSNNINWYSLPTGASYDFQHIDSISSYGTSVPLRRGFLTTNLLYNKTNLLFSRFCFIVANWLPV